MTTITVANHPFAVAFTPDGHFAYVTQAGVNTAGEFTVSKIDTASAALVGEPIEVGNFPTSLGITPDGLQAYVGNERSNSVSVIDTADNSSSLTLSGMNAPRAIAASAVPAGHLVPDLAGQKEIDATFTLISAGLSLGTVTEEPSDSVPAGRVISQNPRANSYLGNEGAVDLVLSSGRNGMGSGSSGGGGGAGFALLALLGLLNALRASGKAPAE
jgi:YVTN family beta-propeller protein